MISETGGNPTLDSLRAEPILRAPVCGGKLLELGQKVCRIRTAPATMDGGALKREGCGGGSCLGPFGLVSEEALKRGRRWERRWMRGNRGARPDAESAAEGKRTRSFSPLPQRNAPTLEGL